MEEPGLAIAEAQRRCRCVLHQIEILPSSTNISLSSKRTLLKLALSELSFVSSISSLSSSDNQSPFRLSLNIGHLEVVVHILGQPFVTGVSRVCKPIPVSSTSSFRVNDNKIRSEGVVVDIVCSINGKPVWFVVSDRNPNRIFWDESPRNSRKGLSLRQRIHQLLAASRSSNVLKPSSIIIFFARGLSDCIQGKLRDEFGASEFLNESGGDWNTVSGRSYLEACVLKIRIDGDENNHTMLPQTGTLGVVSDSCFSEIKKPIDFNDKFATLLWNLTSPFSKQKEFSNEGDIINLDTTALIAFISGISNGGAGYLLSTPDSELIQRFKGNYASVIEEAKSEICNPIHPKLLDIIAGRRCIICKTVSLEFQEIVMTCGGPNEKLRAKQLLDYLIVGVVPDSPSSRIMGLKTTRSVSLKNKTVFGTGDHWRAATLSANMAFVRAVSQTGLSLSTLEHSPRVLTGA